MHLTLISLSIPTFNNVRAASALPYHLIYAAKLSLGAKVDVYSYNINNLDIVTIKKVESKLDVKIHLLKLPKWIKWMMRLHLMFLRVFLKYPLYSYCKLPLHCIKKIKKDSPDKIWIYGEELAGLSRLFPKSKCIVTMPDCESLYYYRMLRQPWATIMLSPILRYSFAYWQYKSMERCFCKNDVIYHFVGKADADFFKAMNKQAKTLFLRHPLYAFNKDKVVRFHQPLIKLLFTGRYDFYCQHASDDFLSSLIDTDLSSSYELTFLGKGWEKWNNRFVNAGYISHHIPFASDYIAELQKHDIQINAIDVGTGTKGKVLDGIANGLLIIGTPFAIENISIQDGLSCIMVENGEEFVSSLIVIRDNRSFYESVAMKGRDDVINKHDTKVIAKQLFLNIN
ncbi:glycosyltransferase family 1 protein [Prevotella denticola]|uniref:glycosyltransferase family 1 protein n=1 Tax=Prevotella denticola TaxID=28129 RepID=UPI00242C98C5|nr:glycosyltransferase family 1 protein [Prevotella denticola]